MNLVYNEYIQFLKDNNVSLGLKEGYYWLDRQIIKCYDKQGNIYKIARLFIDEDLNITYKTYENKPFEMESWLETVERNKDRLLEIEEESLNLIKEKLKEHKNLKPITLTSGGKDSSVTMHLVRSIVDSKAIFNNTSLDCADTYKHIKTIDNIQIINPQEGFYQWRKRLQFVPTRFARGCCSIFKEGAMVDNLDKNDRYLFFMGMRNEESNTRSSYGDEWKNEKWKSREWQGILPIRKWTEVDIWLYVIWKGIEVNEKYKKGYGRVGCAVACPYYTKSTWVLDRYWYSTMYQRWQDILKEDFVNNCKWTRLNCTKREYMTCWNGGALRKEPTEDVVNEFAEHKGVDIEVARKYFNHTCEECNKKVVDKDLVAMNMKFLGRNINKFYCKKHLKELLKIDNTQWNKYVEEFKKQECSLF